MSREQLQQSERMASVGVLAAGIAHEINNPVGTILLAAQNALEQSEECKTLAESQALLRRTCDAIVVNATRCTQIVRGVMQFSRHQATEKWANDINDIVLSAVRLLSDTTEGASRAPILELGVGLPELPLNPIEIEQVIVNLVKNAWEAAPNGVTVIVRTERSHDDGVVLSVEDNGPGISPEQQRQIFDPFFTTRLQAGGTGLGLSLVHGIIKSHRGRIDVDSAPGHGTRIYVVFPVSTSEVASTYSY
jgi:two-component system NtrC family sensor kinase